jgi:hypothetical protein
MKVVSFGGEIIFLRGESVGLAKGWWCMVHREQLGADRSAQQCLQTRLVFQNNGWPWPTSRLTDVVAKTTFVEPIID